MTPIMLDGHTQPAQKAQKLDKERSVITSEDRARGFLQLSATVLGTRSRQEWECTCRDAFLPMVFVRQARFWQVEVHAAPLPDGRFTDDDRTWFHGRAAVALHESPSHQPRIEIKPVRMRTLGLTEDEALALARAIVGHFRHQAKLAGRVVSLPAERPNVIYITTERAKRRSQPSLRDPVKGSTLRVFRDPWNGDAS
jgi:hypothetical protein